MMVPQQLCASQCCGKTLRPPCLANLRHQYRKLLFAKAAALNPPAFHVNISSTPAFTSSAVSVHHGEPVRSRTALLSAGQECSTLEAQALIPWDEQASVTAAVEQVAASAGVSAQQLSDNLTGLHVLLPDLQPSLRKKHAAIKQLMVMRDHLGMLSQRSIWVDFNSRGEVTYDAFMEQRFMVTSLGRLGKHFAFSSEAKSFHRHTERALGEAFERWRANKSTVDRGGFQGWCPPLHAFHSLNVPWTISRRHALHHDEHRSSSRINV